MSIPFASVVFVFSLFLYFSFFPLFYGNIPNDTKSRKMIVTFSDVLLTWHNSVMCITVGVAFRIYNRKMFDIVQILEVDGMELVFFVLMQSGCIMAENLIISSCLFWKKMWVIILLTIHVILIFLIFREGQYEIFENGIERIQWR